MSEKKTFFGIQCLRGLAAVMVVTFHVVSNLRGPPPAGLRGVHALPSLLFGNAGVDLFFVISGFVIVWTTQNNWSQPGSWRVFLDKRASRIFPLYWILTAAKIALVLIAPALFRGTHLRAWNTIASYLLIPSWDAEGRISPIITAGWTLCYEMAFYYVCTICLAMRRPPFRFIGPLFVVVGAIGAFRQPSWGAVASLVDPLLFEFVAGMWIADLARRGHARGSTRMLTGLLVLGAAGWLASSWLDPATAYTFRALVWGGPAALILYAVVCLEATRDFSALRLPLIIGDASYSIYLVHVLVLPPLVSRIRSLPLSPFEQFATCCGLVALGIASGIAVWAVLERQIIRHIMAYARPLRAAWAQPRGTR